MGIFRILFGSGHHDDNWGHEFDRKLAEGKEVDYQMGKNQPRVKDETGGYYTRDGKDCCGCGKSRNMGNYDPDQHTYTGGHKWTATPESRKDGKKPLF